VNMNGQALLNLLPALYRLKDAQIANSRTFLSPAELSQLQSLQALAPPLTAAQQQQLDQLTAKASLGPLQSLLMLIAEQLAIVGNDLDQLYDDQFIETCAPWVIPYIGDLIGYQAVKGVAPAVASPRAEVAQTISLRRRKGTVLVLEQLARDVTGWGAHVVEFFKLLAGTQYMANIRASNYYTVNLRDWETCAYLDTAFDATSHNVDLRRISVERGRYNIQNIGIFLWSLNAYNLTNVPAAASSANAAGGAPCFRFNPLGADMPLFNHPIFQGAEISALAQPSNVPNRLHRRVLCQDIQSGTGSTYYGVGNSLSLTVNGTLLNANQIQVCDLSGAEGSWANLPTGESTFAAAVDPVLGRIALPQPATGSPDPQVQTSFYYGFNADMGGGVYPRGDTFAASPEQIVIRVPDDQPTIHDALKALSGEGVVEITDSNNYSEPSGLTVSVGDNGHIELRAADGQRPLLALGAEITITGGELSQFDLNGIAVTYVAISSAAPSPVALIHAPNGGSNQLSHLGVTHCTLVPGWSLSPQGDPQFSGQPALVAEPSGLQVVLKKTISGGIRVQGLATASISDSLLDANDLTGVAYAALDGLAAGGALTLQCCTVIGKVHATLFSVVSDSIFQAGLAKDDKWTAPLWSDRKQEGCVRFSYLPTGVITPREFECAQGGNGLPQPLFFSLRYGDPGYGKLMPSTDDVVRRGAEDGSEMGAFHFVLSPLRETDLRVRIQEFLPVGLEFGIFYEN
jgi:hypothetical protein